MGQSLGQTVKAAAPDWLIEKLKRDVQLVKRHYNLVKDISLLNMDSFKDVVADMNAIMKTCCVEADQQVVFGVRTGDDLLANDDLLWKAYVKIICLKVDRRERTFSIMRCMNIRQFWLLREGILSELHKRNTLCEGEGEFVLVNHTDCDDDQTSTSTSQGESGRSTAGKLFGSGSSQEDEKILEIDNPLTVSTVMNCVAELGGMQTDECLICLDNPVDTSLPCAHSFCSRCIGQWVSENRSCPTCRDEVKAPHEMWQFTEIPNIAQINRHLIDLATGT